MRFFVLSLLSLGFCLVNRALANSAMLCKDHPAYSPSLRPVIVSSWEYKTSTPNLEQLVYIPRYTGHAFAPVSKEGSSMYKGLDLFHTGNIKDAPTFRMHFQRPAKVYILIDVQKNNFDSSKSASLSNGWKSEGWATRVNGPDTITFGIHETATNPMSQHVYVFSQLSGSDDYVDLPQTRFVKSKLSSLDVTGVFNLLIAESNGNPSPPVGSFKGRNIETNKPCPSSLHDAWMVPDTSNDPSTRGKLFSSWHPQWDPCYWCAYDHEHGSSPEHIMGYTPKFTYTAFKNGMMDESDEGFKGFVIEAGQNYIYYSLHVKQSDLRRVTTSSHTVNIAIVNRGSGELMADLQHKGDFGFQSVRLLGRTTFRPISKRDEEIEQEQKRTGAPLNFRSITVLDKSRPNPEFDFRSPITVGQYEVWQTLPMCAKSKNKRTLLNVQFKQPNTGIKSLSSPSVKVDLGRMFGGKFIKSNGLNRSLKAQGLVFAQQHCPEGASGTFYTDPTGKILRSGPGSGNVRQYIKPGFSATLNGRYETADRWTGLHKKSRRGFLIDHGYGIDANRN